MNVFWQSAYGHLYGRLPEWMRRCLASELLSLNGCHVVSCSPDAISPGQAYLATSFALMRLFTSVHTHMDGKSRPLDELFSAAGIVANVRSHAAVDALWLNVSSEQTGRVE